VADEPSWNQPERPWDLDDAKGMIELLCRRLDIEQPRYETLSGEPLLHPGRAARVVAERDGELALAGLVGELHPAVADEWELRGVRVIVAELDVAGLSAGEASAVQAEAPTRQPAAARDLAIVVAESRSAAVLSEAIRQTAGPDLVSLRLFDIYRGSPLAADQKSLAWRLIFQSRDRTLTEAEIDATIARIAEAVGTVGGRIRT